MTMPKGHVKKGLLHLDQIFEVRGGHSLGDQPQLWCRTFELFLVEELKFDQHQMDPCARLCFVSRGTNTFGRAPPDEIFVILAASVNKSTLQGSAWKFVLCAPCACE